MPCGCSQVAGFGQQLRPHQMALLGDGTTVLARAVIEHNLAAASRLYTNIYFSELGTLLGVPEAQAEAIAARMVQEDRLQARPAALYPASCDLCPMPCTLCALCHVPYGACRGPLLRAWELCPIPCAGGPPPDLALCPIHGIRQP